MAERPILFSGPMVRTILSGNKTQTRRVVKPTQSTPKVAPLHMEPWLIDGEQTLGEDGRPAWAGSHPDYPTGDKWFTCPYGDPGDRLWVRETWAAPWKSEPGHPVIYRASYGGAPEGCAWRPSIHMPRWASRITLEITEVRVERLQDISQADAQAEGVDAIPQAPAALDHRTAFAGLWNKINGKTYPWASNPWVWAITFKKVQP